MITGSDISRLIGGADWPCPVSCPYAHYLLGLAVWRALCTSEPQLPIKSLLAGSIADETLREWLRNSNRYSGIPMAKLKAMARKELENVEKNED